MESEIVRSVTIPVAPFEHLMLVTEAPDYPMWLAMRFTLSGRPEKARLEAAVRAALQRHPLLRCQLRGSPRARTARLRWVPIAIDGQLPIHWDDEEPARTPHDPQHLPFRFIVQQHRARTVITLEVRHAVCDGLGTLQFFEEVLLIYAGRRRALPALHPNLLTERFTLGQTARDWRRRLVYDLLRTAKFFYHRPRALVEAPSARPDGTSDHSTTRALSQAATEALRQAAREASCTVNDLLLRDMFLALNEFNRARGQRRTIRIAMPTDLRGQNARSIPAANLVSMMFLDRRSRICDDPQRLLRTVWHETVMLKRRRIALALCRAVGWLGTVPGLLHGLIARSRQGRCFSTAVLSNLGVVTSEWRLPRESGRIVADDLRLEQVEALPPVMPGTAASFGVTTYAGRLCTALRYDPRRLCSEAANELIDRFQTRIGSYPPLHAIEPSELEEVGAV